MSHLSGAENTQNQGQTLELSSQMFNQPEVHQEGDLLIVPSGQAFSELMIYFITQMILLQLDVNA